MDRPLTMPGPSDALGVPQSGAASDAYRNFVAVMCCIGIGFSYMDRQMIGLVLQPVKLEMHLTDAQLGFMSGVAFAIFYATLGIPIARFADATSRRGIFAVSLGFWSVMTTLSGATTTFVQFLAARIGVGIGESGCNPILYSVLADYYPKKQRPVAFGYLAMATQAGVLVALALGGWTVGHYGWRSAFFVAGIPGLIFAAIWYLTVREPVRGGADERPVTGTAPTFGATVRMLWNSRTYRWLVIAQSCTGFVSFGVGTWMPSFLIRSYAMKPQNLGPTLAVTSGLLSCIGALAGGYLVRRLARKDERWYLWQPAIVAAIAGCLLTIGFLSYSASATIALYAIGSGINSLCLGASFSTFQALVLPSIRATASACWLLIFNFFGVGFGQQFIGFVSDLFAKTAGAESLRYGLIASSFFFFFAALFFWIASRTMTADIADVDAAAAAA
jgi:MFS family permease